jgi:hypothetical protein
VSLPFRPSNVTYCGTWPCSLVPPCPALPVFCCFELCAICLSIYLYPVTLLLSSLTHSLFCISLSPLYRAAHIITDVDLNTPTSVHPHTSALSIAIEVDQSAKPLSSEITTLEIAVHLIATDIYILNHHILIGHSLDHHNNTNTLTNLTSISYLESNTPLTPPPSLTHNGPPHLPPRQARNLPPRAALHPPRQAQHLGLGRPVRRRRVRLRQRVDRVVAHV